MIEKIVVLDMGGVLSVRNTLELPDRSVNEEAPEKRMRLRPENTLLFALDRRRSNSFKIRTTFEQEFLFFLCLLIESPDGEKKKFDKDKMVSISTTENKVTPILARGDYQLVRFLKAISCHGERISNEIPGISRRLFYCSRLYEDPSLFNQVRRAWHCQASLSSE